ncbi:MAG: hypothetical protein ISP45_18705 [Reyranella sp.]|jgi:hypothetical protein|nr:hypothetical protein [Reyranella sp.]
MIRMAAIVLGVLLPFVANAQSLRLKNFLHPENERIRVLNDVYLAGAMDALTAYNMAAPVKLFCKEGDVVSHEEVARLISDWAEKQTKIQDDMIIVVPLLLLLKKAYPCR